jgi:SpoIID/LytB domain protein
MAVRGLVIFGLVSGGVAPLFLSHPAPAQAQDVELQIGIIQRYGDRPKDVLILKAVPGDTLTVRIPDQNGQTKVVTTDSLKLETVIQALPKPRVDERLVFSTHRSFESAEEQAQYWRSRGIEVELAQPDRWQVWAKRSTYKTPTVLRLLEKNLKTQGIQTARIESRTLTGIPKATFTLNGLKYTRDQIEISSGKGMIQVDRDNDKTPNRTFPGRLKLQPNAYGNYSLVNLVALESYLRGVVPYEIGTGAPQAAMQAQAVMARTYVLRNLRRFATDNYQLCATTQCQVYFGTTGVTNATDNAIAATRGLVVTYNNELVDALYSSTTGGITAPFNEVWRGKPRPYLIGKVDAVGNVWNLRQRPLVDENNLRAFLKLRDGFNESQESSYFRWQTESSMETLKSDIKKYLQSIGHPLAGFNSIQEIQVMERSSAGRVAKMGIETDLGIVILEKDEILLAFEAPNSLLFYIDPISDANRNLKGYKFIGGGFGHAVGLSQFGSYALGKQGFSYDRILTFYFPGSQIQQISPQLTYYRDPG